MIELLGLVLAAAAAFAATNVDDLLLLTALFGVAHGDHALRGGQIVAGQYLGVGALVALSAAAALGLLLVPAELVGLLGLVPIALGVRAATAGRAGTAGDAPAPLPAALGIGGIAAITVANGADNIAIYVPFLASVGAEGIAVVIVVFTALVAVWCLVARHLGSRPAVRAGVERHGHVVIPVVLVGLGVLVLVQAGTVAAVVPG